MKSVTSASPANDARIPARIESRPTKRRPWEYVNFVDFEGHRDGEVVRAVLAEVKERCQFLKVLGSYPAA